MSRRLLFLLGTALVVRLFFVFVFVEFVYPGLYPFVDGDQYLELADEFHNQQFLFTAANYLRLPLYPAMIAYLTFIPMEEITLMRLWNIGLDIATLLFIYLFVRKATSEKYALVSGWLYTFYPLGIYRLGMINTEIIQATLLMGILLGAYFLLKSGKVMHALLLSFLITVLLFINPAAQLLPFILAVVFFFQFRWQHAIALSSALLIPIIVFAVGWGYRNYYVMGSFYLFDARGGKEFWVGNNQSFDGMEVGPHRQAMLEKIREVRSSVVNRMTLEKENDIFFRMGMKEITSDPAGAVILFLKKAFRFWYVPASGRMVWAAFPIQTFFLLLGLIGAYVWRTRLLELGMLLLVICYFWGIYTLVFACIRYSHQVMPLVCILGGMGVVYVWDWWNLRRR